MFTGILASTRTFLASTRTSLPLSTKLAPVSSHLRVISCFAHQQLRWMTRQFMNAYVNPTLSAYSVLIIWRQNEAMLERVCKVRECTQYRGSPFCCSQKDFYPAFKNSIFYCCKVVEGVEITRQVLFTPKTSTRKQCKRVGSEGVRT